MAVFFIGQGLVQGLNLINGFLLIRWLSIGDYAIYSMATSFQGTVGILVELGLGSSIVALLSGRTDPQVVGGYIRATRYYRNRFFISLFPVIAVALPLLAVRQGCSFLLTAALLIATLVTLYFQSWVTYYSVPLLLHQNLALYYKTPSLLSGLRLVVVAGLYLTKQLTALASIWLNALSTIVQGWSYRWQSAHHIIEPREINRETNREVLSYIRPLLPSTIFFALQGQISVLLISCFGKAESIAEVGALGRIGQLFVMLGTFNSVVIAPYIAGVSSGRLLYRYCQLVAGALFVSCGVIGFALIFPAGLLWILGSKYEHLRSELPWMMLSSCAGYVAGVLWTMHAARKWIFSWGVWAYIASVVLTQVIAFTFMDLSTTSSVIRLSVYSSLATLFVQMAWGIVGFISHDRRAHAS